MKSGLSTGPRKTKVPGYGALQPLSRCEKNVAAEVTRLWSLWCVMR